LDVLVMKPTMQRTTPKHARAAFSTLTSSILGLTRIIAATAPSQEHEHFLLPSQAQPYIANRPLGTRPPNRRTTHRAEQTDSTPLTCMSLSSVSPSCPKTAQSPRPPDHARANKKSSRTSMTAPGPQRAGVHRSIEQCSSPHLLICHCRRVIVQRSAHHITFTYLASSLYRM
jgi:hypothetical protein